MLDVPFAVGEGVRDGKQVVEVDAGAKAEGGPEVIGGDIGGREIEVGEELGLAVHDEVLLEGSQPIVELEPEQGGYRERFPLFEAGQQDAGIKWAAQ